MLKFNNKLAFGIKINEKDMNSLEYKLFFDAVNRLAEKVPGFVAEGIGNIARKAEENTILTGICTPIGTLAFISTEKEPRMVCVGLSDKYDISFENEKDIYLGYTCCRIPKIPVFDLKKEFNTILSKLGLYIKTTYTKQSNPETPAPKVVYHSNFILVGSTRVAYGDTATFNRLVGNAPKADNSLDEILKLIYTLSR